jgi:hypothetical protein
LFLCVISLFSATVTGLVIAAEVSDSDVVDVTAVVPGIVTPPGGGSSGGSGSQAQQATVILTGNSFPGSKLTLLKDGLITTTLVANNDGTFQITINNLNFGNYQLSLIAEDSTGISSSPHVINVSAFSTTPYIYGNIVLPPTIAISNLSIQMGSSFKVYGFAAPGSTVNLEIPGIANLGSSIANASGYYEITTVANRAPNTYFLRTKANFNGFDSLYSKPVQITYFAGQGQPTPPSQYSTCVDYNKDGKVNLIDFSILLFWFNKPSPPNSIDCNGDAAINIKDFSILMYFWTG